MGCKLIKKNSYQATIAQFAFFVKLFGVQVDLEQILENNELCNHCKICLHEKNDFQIAFFQFNPFLKSKIENGNNDLWSFSCSFHLYYFSIYNSYFFLSRNHKWHTFVFPNYILQMYISFRFGYNFGARVLKFWVYSPLVTYIWSELDI